LVELAEMRHVDDQAKVTLRTLDSDLHESFERLLAKAWNQNWSGDLARDIFRWRYCDRPQGHITWLACVGDDCVAMVDSRIRPYQLRGKSIMVRETADWFCLQQYRPLGLGLWVLRQLKHYPEPVLVMGGSAYTLEILPRLRWDMLGSVRSYVLPVTARGLAANLIRQRWPMREAMAQVIPRWVPARRPVRLPSPPGRPDIELLNKDTWYDLPVDASSELVGMLDQDHWNWLASAPHDFARSLGIVFRLDGNIVGFCLAQLEPTATGLDGRIVHLQTINNEVPLIGWVLSTTVEMLVEQGAEFIRCCVSTPAKIAAIESIGFILSQEFPCHWWNRPGIDIPGSIDLDYLRGDDALPLGAIRGRRLDHVRR
jgi:hypothetical protein